LKLSQYAHVEDLARNAVLAEDRAITATKGAAIIALMKESK